MTLQPMATKENLNGKTVVLAYSGGLDTSVMVRWLKERGAEVVTATGDLGGNLDVDSIRAKALASGAKEAYVADLRDAFVEDFLWPALRAGALYQNVYPLATALGRPLLAQYQVQIAREVGADFVAHGCTGKGNDQVRFEVSIATLAPELTLLAPLREWELKTRDQEIAYAEEHGIPIEATSKSPYSIDENIWGIAIECGALEDPWTEPPVDAWRWTNSVADAPDSPEELVLSFEQGVPVGLDGSKFSGLELIETLNQIGGRHGIGRMDLIEDRLVGIKSREIYEAPAAVLLHAAREELDRLILDRDTRRFLAGIGDGYARLTYDGLWFAPLRQSMQAAADQARAKHTGEVRLRLCKGNIICTGRRSPWSLYDESLATYGDGDRFRHASAAGFIELWGLPSRTAAEVARKAAATDKILAEQASVSAPGIEG